MSRSRSSGLLALTLILIAVGLLVLNLGGYLGPAQSLVLRPFGAVQGWIASRVAAVRSLLTAPGDVIALREENDQLQAQVSALQQEIIALREQAAQADILAALLGYARGQPESRYLAVNVIGRDVSPFIRSVWIGRGSDAGLLRGMPVVTERGLVGRIAEVHATVSRVQLITDPATEVNVRLQTSRADGALRAQVNGELWVDLIDQAAEVTPGELVLTSGLGGAFPPEVPVGQVLTVRKRDFELFQQAVIQPSVDFENLEIVLVITNFQPLLLTPEVP
ncbi:MAG TPA: rod shape-determining protein MreC [Anaerolineales bacterium]|nr:rod shape-determining protein MreC [Anaerolineales bacterium]